MDKTLPRALGYTFAGIAVGALIAPRRSAAFFGLPTTDPTAIALVRAVGARDLILGALVLTALDDEPALRRVLRWSALAGLADAAAVASVHGLRPQHLVHLSGAAVLALAALA
jgi:hypothetical protein